MKLPCFRKSLPVFVLAASLFAPATLDCRPPTPADVDMARETADVSCIIANAFLPNVPAIRVACGLVPAMDDFIRRVADEHRAGVKREFEKAGLETRGFYPLPAPRDAGAGP